MSFLYTLFHALLHMEYDEVIPNGPTMAMASLGHKGERVVGYALKASANWNAKVSLRFLKTNELPDIRSRDQQFEYHG